MMVRNVSIPAFGLLLVLGCGLRGGDNGESDAAETGAATEADGPGVSDAGASSGLDGGTGSEPDSGSSTIIGGTSELDSTTGWPECPEVHEGDLMINDDTDLDALALVGHVTGSVRVIDYSGADLQFLACLHAVDGEMWISQAPNLQNLTGLDSLQHLGALVLRENPALASVAGLGEVHTLGSLTIRGNASLASIDLPQVKEVIDLHIGGCTFIFDEEDQLDNPLLADLDGLTGLESLHSLHVGSQSAIVSLARVREIATAGGFDAAYYTSINNNPNLPYDEVELLRELMNQDPDIYSCGNLGEPDSNQCYCDNPG
jgi:hypothetical protein